MAKIAYILLCHKDAAAIAQQARRLTAMGDCVAIHFDASAPRAEWQKLKAALTDVEGVVFADRRHRCGWGEWSLVAATLSALRAAYRTFTDATHFYLMSGDCWPIKTAEYAHAALDATDADFIEANDFFTSGWIKTGMVEDRLIYRHWFNERTQPRRFYGSYALQKKLRLTRNPPADLRIMIGSQWWCLRRSTIEAILGFLARRRDVTRFFRTTWIPDETFFQTLVPHLVPAPEIENRTLTFLMFSAYGMPVNFYNDHYNLLLGQDYLFARKISPEADDLKKKLGQLYAMEDVTFRTSNEGARLYDFLTGRGRIGERFAPRFWERNATIGRDRSLMIVTCKKWHVAKRLVDRIGRVSNVPRVEYLFDEEATQLPDLGGIQATLEKRQRHRRALMKMLFDYYETERLLICLDPANLELFRDFYADRCETRTLEIECGYTDDYLRGHARRVGLAGQNTSDEAFRTLLPTIRNDIARESEDIRGAQFPEFYRLREKWSAEENARPLSEFLRIDRDAAREIAALDYLFTD